MVWVMAPRHGLPGQYAIGDVVEHRDLLHRIMGSSTSMVQLRRLHWWERLVLKVWRLNYPVRRI